MDDDYQQIRRYLSGSLPESEAEAFERRLFADDRLGREFERHVELQAALQDRNAEIPAAPSTRRHRLATALALAAGAAVLAVGLHRLASAPGTEPVLRGTEQRIDFEVRLDNGRLLARWEAVHSAEGYELSLLTADGTTLTTVQVAAPRSELALEIGDGKDLAQEPAFAELVALDALRQTIVRSDRQAVSN